MAVKIRLRRMGKKRQPSYRVVVADARSPRDGRFIEQIGRYDPLQEPSLVDIDNDRALDWLQKGAQPTEAVRKLLEISGAWGRFRAAKGEIHTIGEPPAPPPPKQKPSRKRRAAAASEGAEVSEEVASGQPEEASEAVPEPEAAGEDGVAEASEEAE